MPDASQIPPEQNLKPAIPLTGNLAAGRQSLCAPLEQIMEPAVETGLSAQRIYKDFYHSVQRFVRQ